MRGVTCLSKENCLFNNSKTKIKCTKNELLRHITKTDQKLRLQYNSIVLQFSKIKAFSMYC